MTTLRERVVRLIFSNALEPLTAALARDIEAWRQGDLGRLLDQIPIAVPDRLVARYLNLELAEQMGASVNLRFPFLSGAFESCMTQPLAARLLNRDRLTERLAIVLGDEELLADDVMAPARAYVQTGEAESSARRRAELALELSRLFLEYSSTRPIDFRKFAECRDGDESFGGAAMFWQRRLWRAVCRPLPGEASDMPPLAPLSELILTASNDELEPPEAFFVVGGSRTSPAHRLMLERLAQTCEVYVYAFNACREFWEDVEKSPDECPPLAYWGRAGRAPVRLLSELASFDFETRYMPPTSDSALDRIKLDILGRQSDAGSRRRLPRDDSIRIWAAPDIRRELEHIGESIWTLARKHDDLALNEIGVLLAGSDRDLYRAQISSVFGSLARLPHHISLVPLASESRVAEALAWLIELPLGSFTRPEMLRVLTHPAVIGARADIDPSDWVGWVRDLGVFFGGDSTVHRGTYLSGDVYHWDQALLRLGLGACVERDPDETPVSIANRVVLAHPQPTDKRRSAAHLALLARSLIADVSWLRKQEMSLAAWADVLWRYASAYVEASSEREAAELGRCRSALLSVGDIDQPAAVPMTTAIELLRAALAGLETRRGEPLTEGVCVAPLSSPPLVPFRFLFIAGLSGGCFPSSDSAGIDARSRSAQAAEPGASDRDRYSFLHALLSAREAVTISYVGRDQHSGDSLAPSSVVAELAHLAKRELTAPAARALTDEIAPSAHLDPQTESRGVNIEARLRTRAAQLARGIRGGQQNRSRRHLLDAVRRGSGPRARALLGMSSSLGEPEPSDRELSAADLARFLDSPLDAWGRSVLGLRESDASGRTSANEPLDLSPLDRSSIMREAVCGLAIEGPSGGDLATRLRAAADRLLLASTGPSGEVAAWQVDAALDGAAAWWQVLTDLGPMPSPTSLAIGRAREGATIAELAPPVVLGDDPFVETHGQFPLVAKDGSAQAYFHRGDAPPATRPARALVDHLLLAASNRVSARRVLVYLVGTRRAQTLELDAFESGDARAHLSALARELLEGEHAYELAGSRVFANHLRGLEPLDRIAEHSAARKPAYALVVHRRPGDFELPSDLVDIVERRYKPLLARLRRLS